ncbi:hypothetical protein ACEPPN_010999 [Leptodophora sp. 'Broadleaf-Isolate-01']
MEVSRSSRRVQGLAPEDSQNSKRRPKPNTNSLLAFEQAQASQGHTKAPTKRRRRRTTVTEPKETESSPSTSSPKAQRQKLAGADSVKEVVDVPSSPAPISTPVPTTTKMKAPFDPKVLFDKPPQNVIFNLWTFVNKSRENAIVKNWDINSISNRLTYKRLCEVIWTMAIVPWMERRSTLPSEKPLKQAFEFLFGNTKNPLLVMSVRDQESFDDAMVPLRTYHYKKLAAATEITVNAYYKTLDQVQAFDSDEDSASKGKDKRKSKGKSKADRARDTARPTPLGLDEDEEIDPDDVFGLLSDREDATPSSPTPRDSVTNRRLSEKRLRDAKASAVEATRAEIFNGHICTERLCDNKNKCCYILPQRKTHHYMDLKRQLQWAAAIHAKTPRVTTTLPPVDWIAAFAEGDRQTNYKPKLSGMKKLDQVVVETPAKSDGNPSSIEAIT